MATRLIATGWSTPSRGAPDQASSGEPSNRAWSKKFHVVKESMLEKDLERPVICSSVACAMNKLIEGFDQMSRSFVPAQNQNGPAHRSRDQCTCGLVNVEVVLQRDQRISENKNKNEEGFHEKGINSIFDSNELFEGNGQGRRRHAGRRWVPSMTALKGIPYATRGVHKDGFIF